MKFYLFFKMEYCTVRQLQVYFSPYISVFTNLNIQQTVGSFLRMQLDQYRQYYQ
jgi:hypothetical protein